MPISTLKNALKIIFFGQSLQEVMQQKQEDYIKHPQRVELVQFEKEVKLIRENVAKGFINPEYLNHNLRVWAKYERKTFYIQLRLLYLNRGFVADAQRVLEQSSKGAKITIIKDDNGATVSETLNADYGKPIFVDW